MAAGGDRATRRGHGRALDRKTRGATLIEQDGAERTTGSGLGQRESRSVSGAGGARGEGQVLWQGSGPQVPEAPPGEPGHHAQQRLPDWPGRTAARPMAKPQKRARETAEKKQKRTKAHASEEAQTREEKTGATTQESGPAQERGPGPRARTMILGPESPEGPQAANKPEFAEHCVSRFPG